jgi:spectinomycin phosphotransferase
MGEQPKIPEERLHACLHDRYDLNPVTIAFLPRGHDYHAGVYRVTGAQGTPYLLKVTSRSLYEPSCLVPGHLSDQGISAVVAPVPTTSGALWTTLADWIAIVYPFIDGDTSLTGMTNAQWRETGTVFKQIHQVPLPPGRFHSLRKETFDPAGYVRWVRDFETQHLPAAHHGPGSERALHTTWVAHQATIHRAVIILEKLAVGLQPRALPYVICHADLHAANLLRDHAGHVFVIDWDEVMLAPKERDFIFLREPQTDAFWEGYGQQAIDWLALTYYRWERIVQDFIENARDVCLRDDVAEATKADLVRRFDADLDEHGEHFTAAYAAAAHLPADLTAHIRKNSC